VDDALTARQQVHHWTVPLQLNSTVAFLINVVLHRIFGWAATPVKIDYNQVSSRKLPHM
jgi:hypothetical protein